MRIKTAGEIMVPLDLYPYINHNETLHKAIEVLNQAQLEHKGKHSTPRMLLVFDDIHQLVGILRRRDILQGIMPASAFADSSSLIAEGTQFGIAPDPNLTEMMYERIIRSMRRGTAKKVFEVMKPTVRWVNHDDHLPKAVFYVVSEDISLLPVVREGRVVGVLRSIDILHEVDRLIMEDDN